MPRDYYGQSSRSPRLPLLQDPINNADPEAMAMLETIMGKTMGGPRGPYPSMPTPDRYSSVRESSGRNPYSQPGFSQPTNRPRPAGKSARWPGEDRTNYGPLAPITAKTGPWFDKAPDYSGETAWTWPDGTPVTKQQANDPRFSMEVRRTWRLLPEYANVADIEAATARSDADRRVMDQIYSIPASGWTHTGEHHLGPVLNDPSSAPRVTLAAAKYSFEELEDGSKSGQFASQNLNLSQQEAIQALEQKIADAQKYLDRRSRSQGR